MHISKKMNLEMIERIIADLIMINVSFLGAFMFRFFSYFVTSNHIAKSNINFSEIFDYFLRSYFTLFWILTLISLIIFYLSGFYTYGRFYKGKYKAVTIFQAISLSYLIFSFIIYFFHLKGLPRSVLILSYILSLVTIGGLRILSALWRRATWAEVKIWGKPKINSIKNILIIGGAGYIGSVLARRLLERGFYVSVLDTLLYGDESIKNLLKHDKFEFIRGDMRNVEAIAKAIQHNDALVHLGALVGDPACSIDENLTLEINLAATRMIAELAKGFGVQRFIFASTCSVYGASDDILDEKSVIKPLSIYSRSKAASELALIKLCDEYFCPIILRFATVYGYSPRPRFDLVVNLLAAKATCEKSITIFGGQQWRPFIHVLDVVDAIMLCLEAPVFLLKGQIFNVGSDEQNYKISQLGEITKQIFPEVEIKYENDNTDIRNYKVSFEKIRKMLDFKAKRTIHDGMIEIRNAIKDGLIGDYKDKKYSNHKSLLDDYNYQMLKTISINYLYSPNKEDIKSKS